MAGFAKIKPEYTLENHARQVNLDYVSHKDKALRNSETEEPETEIGLEPSKKKLRGQNKQRPRETRQPRSEKLCLKFLNDGGCPYGDKCSFSHDLEAFAQKRPKDIGNKCYLFETYGHCQFGFLCRFGSSHLSADHTNIVNKDLWDQSQKSKSTSNSLSKDLQLKLRKREFNFKKSNDVLNIMTKRTDAKYTKNECAIDNAVVPKNDKEGMIGAVLDEDIIRLKPAEKKVVDFNRKLYLAPLTTVGNLPYRRICKEFGADITCGEMAMCSNLLQGQQSEWALLRRHYTEDVFGVQICGAHADSMTRCGQLLSETINVDFVDINMGCPIDLVYQKGAGCGLMGRVKKFEEVTFGMSSVLNVPLTVKMRTGIHSNRHVADTLIQKLKSWGDRIAMIALHGRSREQRYTKEADWKYISQCAEVAKPIPLYGCGDIVSFEEANFHLENSGVSGLMLARGALLKPWIFTEIKEQRHWDISSSERFEIIKKYVNYGLEHWGSDSEGVEKTRRFLLEWLSFLYRYIPVGLLENVPQKINERPPPYFGRDDMETLMASPSCADWIKISEMLLGPVPGNFSFLPKHKANAYQ